MKPLVPQTVLALAVRMEAARRDGSSRQAMDVRAAADPVGGRWRLDSRHGANGPTAQMECPIPSSRGPNCLRMSAPSA